MSKKRKTRKEKIQASERHDFTPILTLPALREMTSSVSKIQQVQTTQIYSEHKDYSYVLIDSKKTLFITSLIILMNVVFFYVLRLSIIKIPGLNF